MDSIKVKKEELLAKLKENKDTHRKIFLEAQEGYRTLVIEQLETMLSDARGGKKINRHLSLSEPTDQTRDYDRVIRMLEMSQDDVVELSEHDFAQYVLDDWSWKRNFLVSNSVYSATATGILNE